jgi:hypothetical protein
LDFVNLVNYKVYMNNENINKNQENQREINKNNNQNQFSQSGIYLRDDHCDWGSSGMNEFTQEYSENK